MPNDGPRWCHRKARFPQSCICLRHARNPGKRLRRSFSRALTWRRICRHALRRREPIATLPGSRGQTTCPPDIPVRYVPSMHLGFSRMRSIGFSFHLGGVGVKPCSPDVVQPFATVRMIALTSTGCCCCRQRCGCACGSAALVGCRQQLLLRS